MLYFFCWFSVKCTYLKKTGKIKNNMFSCWIVIFFLLIPYLMLLCSPGLTWGRPFCFPAWWAEAPAPPGRCPPAAGRAGPPPAGQAGSAVGLSRPAGAGPPAAGAVRAADRVGLASLTCRPAGQCLHPARHAGSGTHGCSSHAMCLLKIYI